MPTERQRYEEWAAKYSSEYTQNELEKIDRFWTALGKKIKNGARIRDGRL